MRTSPDPVLPIGSCTVASIGSQGCVSFGQGQGRWLALPASEGEIAISRTGRGLRGKCSRGHGRPAGSNNHRARSWHSAGSMRGQRGEEEAREEEARCARFIGIRANSVSFQVRFFSRWNERRVYRVYEKCEWKSESVCNSCYFLL